MTGAAGTAGPLIGVIDAGSSSLKFTVFEGERRLLLGRVDGLGSHPTAHFTFDGKAIAPPEFAGATPATPSEALSKMLPWARKTFGASQLDALGHRVAHGGVRHAKPARVTAELLAELKALVPLAPLQEAYNLGAIRITRQINPELPQVACFDTAFHRTASDVEQAYALPYALYEQGVRRYGFHGLSYEYIASELPQRAPEIADGRVVVLHLGSSCSACAIRAGVSVATTMGFSGLDGLPMGTRCGALDPGVVLHLMQREGLSVAKIGDLLHLRSGLLGLSGISADFRELLASDEPRARFAIEVFCHWTARQIGSLAAALGGLDGVVFTAGVGENAAPIRSAICQACAWLGLELDETANRQHRARISRPDSRVAAYVIKTDPDLMVARHARALLGADSPGK